jgi:hypothetical protein
MKKKKVTYPGRPTGNLSLNTQDVILKAYFELSHKEGMESVTLQKLAHQSGLALNTIRYHFNMQGISLSKVALDYVSDKTYEFLDTGMLKARSQKGFDPVQAYIQVTFDWITQQPIQASFLVYYYYLCSTQTEITISNHALVEIAQQRITGFIYEGLGMKLYHFQQPIENICRQIHMSLMGACLIMITSRDKKMASLHAEQCLENCKSLLGIMQIHSHAR